MAVRVGQRAPSTLGLNAILDFSIGVTLDGETLTEAELRSLRASTEGLALVRGRWVEVDRERLDQVLAHWKTAERQARKDGLTFLEGMRLLAGANLSNPEHPIEEATREWSEVVAGDWLATTLQRLRDPYGDVTPSDVGLGATLRPYQQAGVSWLRLLSSLGLGACLADDMGLGKTIQVLALLLDLKRRTKAKPHLLVVPASLITNWQAEIARLPPPSWRAVGSWTPGPSTPRTYAVPPEHSTYRDVMSNPRCRSSRPTGRPSSSGSRVSRL